jgi:hypothetical protein
MLYLKGSTVIIVAFLALAIELKAPHLLSARSATWQYPNP